MTPTDPHREFVTPTDPHRDGVCLLQHYLKYHFQCDIFPLRYDLKNASTTESMRNEQGYNATLEPRSVRRSARPSSGPPFTTYMTRPYPVQLYVGLNILL